MALRLAAFLPRLAALVVIALLATSTLTFAAANRRLAETPPPPAPPAGPKTLVVPDVRRQAYVFAKGILEDGGFAWRVEGRVQGYAANLVARQAPAPGTRVVDTGSPIVVLRLERNAAYAERGLPENESPYPGTKLVSADAPPAPKPGPKPKPKPKAKAKAKAKAPAQPPAPAHAAATPEPREPAFHVPGAPPEPLDEMPLTDRARLLEQRVLGKAKPTKRLVKYWLYQHSWIVSGARFGWSDGDEALRIVLRLDKEMQARWGLGARSAAVARAALAEVEAAKADA